jgi:hypothetical protein
MFNSFDIGNEKIRCTDASELQTLIPYVERLLRLFSQVKQDTKRALSSDKVRNRVYQFETSRYIERISQSPMEFNSDASSFREFLETEQNGFYIYRWLVKGDEWTGIIKVYQVLQTTSCLYEGYYTILKLKLLLTVNRLMDFSKLRHSVLTPHLLLIASEDKRNY